MRDTMPSAPPPIFPSEQKILAELGERLRLARLRRNLGVADVAARARISRMTLHRAENGSAAVSLGTCVRILSVLHLADDLNLVAADDRLGRRLQDLEMPTRQRAPKRKRSP